MQNKDSPSPSPACLEASDSESLSDPKAKFVGNIDSKDTPKLFVKSNLVEGDTGLSSRSIDRKDEHCGSLDEEAKTKLRS